MTPQKNSGGCDGGQGQDERSDPNRSRDSMHRESQHICANAKNRRPKDSSSGVEEKEARPRHAIDTREQSGSRAQQSDKSSEEDDCASVTAKEVLPELDPPLVEPDARPIACYERKSYDPTDPVPDVVADHRAGARSSNNAHDIKIVARTGVNRSGN